MTSSCILPLNYTILFSLCLTLQNMSYPLWEAKTAGRAGCPTELCSRRGCKERHNLFKEVVDVAAAQGRQKKPLVAENLTCPSKVLGLCIRRKLFSQKRSKHCLTDMLNVVKKYIGWWYFLWRWFKKTLFFISETRTCKQLSLDPGFKWPLPPFFNQWERSWKNKGGT